MTSFLYSEKYSGLIGSLIFCAFLIVCLWRCRMIFQNVRKSHEKKIFHIMLTGFALFEFGYFLELFILDRVAVWGYCFHVLALFCNFMSFAMVVRLWRETLLNGPLSETMRDLEIFCISLNCIITVVTISLLAVSDSFDSFRDRYKAVYDIFTMTNIISLLAISSGLLIGGMHLIQSLTTISSSSIQDNLIQPTNHNQFKKDILHKINGVMWICCGCYMLRISCLVFVIKDEVTGSTYIENVPDMIWFLITNWIPYLVTSSVLLVMMTPPPAKTERGSITTGTGNVGDKSYRHNNATLESGFFNASVNIKTSASHQSSSSHIERISFNAESPTLTLIRERQSSFSCDTPVM